VRRLKNSLSVEHPIAGDELRAIKRYLTSRTDRLPWLFLSERAQPLTRSSVQYLVRVAGVSVGLHASIRTCCGTRAATILHRWNSTLEHERRFGPLKVFSCR
jgi:hypothetical protein